MSPRPMRPCGSAPARPRKAISTSARILAAARETGADAIHPGYGFLSRECRLRRGLRRRRHRLHRADAGQYPRLRPEAQRPRARRGRRRAAGAGHRAAGGCGGGNRSRGADRLSRDAQGDRRRRRHRHARLRRSLRPCARAIAAVARLGAGNFGDAGVFLERFVPPRPACRSADLRRRHGPRRRARRARLLAPAPQPEGDRGGPCPQSSRACPRRADRGGSAAGRRPRAIARPGRSSSSTTPSGRTCSSWR